MDSDKIGKFIKKLRTDKGLSQYELADLIPIDRSVISKWERGEATPPMDKILILSEIFNVSIVELISGELKTKENAKEHEKNLFNFLSKQDSKYKKLKVFSILSFIVILILIFLFLIYYFLETHNTEKIYRISGESTNYVLSEGILVITREKSYLKLGAINDEIYNIKLYYKKDDKKSLIYSGRSDMVLSDRYGYDASLNDLNLYEMRNDLYIEVNGEEIKLNLSDEYFNDNLTLDNWDNVSDSEDIIDENNGVDIDKIKKEFECDELVCRKNIDNMDIEYSIVNSAFHTIYNDINVEFDIENKIFSYSSKYEKFFIYDDVLICEVGPCDDHKEIYDKYYINLIEKYLK